jgi:hypothetical protein
MLAGFRARPLQKSFEPWITEEKLFRANSNTAIRRSISDKLREGWVSVADFGADKTGVADATTNIQAAEVLTGNARILFTPAGNYLFSGTVYNVDADHIHINRGYTGALNQMSIARTNTMTITQQTSASAVHSSDLTRIGIAISSWAYGAQHATGVRSNLYNSSTDGNGCTSFYGHAQSDTDAQWSAVHHGEIRHGGGTGIGLNIEAGSFTTLGNFYGAVLNNTTASLGAAGTTNSLTGGSAIAHPDATGLLVLGTNNTDPMGGWVKGIEFHANSMRAGGACITVNATAAVASVLDTSASTLSATADIVLRGNSANGILLQGAYTGVALRINTGERIGLEGTGTVKFGYDTGTTSIQFLNGATNRVSIITSATPGIAVNGTKVIGARDTGWAAMTGTSNKNTVYDTATVTLAQLAGRVMALQATHTAHGLIGA